MISFCLFFVSFQEMATDLEEKVPDLLSALQRAFADWKDPVLEFMEDLDDYLRELPGIVEKSVGKIKGTLDILVGVLKVVEGFLAPAKWAGIGLGKRDQRDH